MMSDQSTIFTLQLNSDIAVNQPVKANTNDDKFFGNLRNYKEKTCGQKVWILPPLKEIGLDENDRHILRNGCFGPLTQAILIIASFSVTLLPVNNVFLNPEYWYEIVLSTINWAIFIACIVAVEIEVVLSGHIMKSRMRIAIEIFLTLKITEILCISFIHIIWSPILGYFEPFPLRQTISSYLSLMVAIVRAWYLIPKTTRMDQIFRKRCKFFVFFHIWAIFATIELLVIGNVLGKVPRDFRWMASLLVPLSKEINDRIICALLSKCSSPGNNAEIQFIGKIFMNISYSFWIAIQLAGNATKATEFVLLGINFVINLSLCYKIIRLEWKIKGNASDVDKNQRLEKEILTELILNEYVEVAVPIALVGSVSAAYYGPNKDTLGTIGCKIWHHQKMEDLQSFLMPVLEMTLIDFLSTILAWALLWYFSRINIWREYCKTIKHYWIYLALWGGAIISAVSIANYIDQNNVIISNFHIYFMVF